MRRLAKLLASVAVVALIGLVAASGAGAQTRTARVVAADGAQRAITAALAEARNGGWNVSISVVDINGDLVGFLRMDGAPLGSVDISQAKARTSARMKRPTRALDSTLMAGRTAILGLPGVTPVEGGVPVIVNGEMIGAIGVSGATSAQDAQVAQAGAAAIQP